MAGGTVVNQWSAANSRVGDVASPVPAVSPLEMPLDSTFSTGGGSGTPTVGNWLFAVAAWRQDAGTAGVLQYPSTVTVIDDVHNFWIPVYVVPPETGIVRCSVWMAPAARAPAWVFASPTAYQQAVTFTVLEVTADVPWYSVAAMVAASTNQGTSVTAAQDPATGLFSIGVIAYDLNTLTVTFTSTGWTEQVPVVTTNSADHTSDITMTPFTAATTGSSMTLAASGTGGNADWAEVLITVHGVSDAIAFPYQSLFQLQNWPALITEMACGQVLNANFTFNAGIASWTAGNNATLAASALYTFGNSAGTLTVTPDGSTANPSAVSENTFTISPGVAYQATAWINVPAGWTGGAKIGMTWYTSGGSSISSSTSAAFTVTGGQQQLTLSAISPATTGRGQIFVELAGTPTTAAVMYVAYAAFGIPGAYGATDPDQLQWIDLSARTITQEPIRISRGIQYQQQSLEAGTMDITVANNDGALTQGNEQSVYYPNGGDDDVPVRLRAVWPSSVTPYSVLFSGYTDEVKPQLDDATFYGYAGITAADCWSRLTAQMLTAAQQEMLADSPAALWPCADIAGSTAAANIAPTSLPALTVQPSKYGTGGVTPAFGSTNITLIGDPGTTGWQQSGLTGSGDILKGWSLIVFPSDPAVLPPIAGGVTVEFWAELDTAAAGINWSGTMGGCVNATGLMWVLSVETPTGGQPGAINMTVFDKTTGASTVTLVDSNNNYNSTHFYSVLFTQTTWTVLLDGDFAADGSCNFAPIYNGFTFNGSNVPYASTAGRGFNGTLQEIAVFPGVLPTTRCLSHYTVAANAELDEYDTRRVCRVAGYGGFVPPLALRNLGLPQIAEFGLVPLVAGVDPVTQITDTVGQVVSDYATNIASSTLAVMFVDGPGALVYRRREEAYNRTQGQWVLGEQASLPLNINPSFSFGVASWTATHAALTFAAGQGQFNGSGAAKLTANGSGAVGFVPENQPASPGVQYSCVIAVRCPAGDASGAFASLAFLDSGASPISSVLGATSPLVAGAWTWLIVTGTAPPATAYIRPAFTTNDTPSNGTIYYVDSAVATIWPGEAPYLRDIRLSDDRAQMFNTAVLSQTGTGTRTTFAGSNFDFSPSSGVVVTATNQASVDDRGSVPYTATVYLQNTAQSADFVPDEGSIEDLASWIVQTLGNPVLRPEQAVLTPGATWQSMITALQAEVGDTVTFFRRPIGAPSLELVTYVSRLEHQIDVREGWTTTYELSPAPFASVLACDDPALGVLDGSNVLGW